jgi:hypothetical protein
VIVIKRRNCDTFTSNMKTDNEECKDLEESKNQNTIPILYVIAMMGISQA